MIGNAVPWNKYGAFAGVLFAVCGLLFFLGPDSGPAGFSRLYYNAAYLVTPCPSDPSRYEEGNLSFSYFGNGPAAEDTAERKQDMVLAVFETHAVKNTVILGNVRMIRYALKPGIEEAAPPDLDLLAEYFKSENPEKMFSLEKRSNEKFKYFLSIRSGPDDYVFVADAPGVIYRFEPSEVFLTSETPALKKQADCNFAEMKKTIRVKAR